MQDFDRMSNPFEVQTGLDELPVFVPDEAYLRLKSACWQAYEALNMKRIHRYSMEELKGLIDSYDDLAKEANASLRYFATNECFVYLYYDLCERYAVLKAYLLISDRLTYTMFESCEIRTIKEVVELRDHHSSIYDQTYFVAEFSDFRCYYEICREAALFLELDTKNAKQALRDKNILSELGWINYYEELFNRINEMLGLIYFPFNTEYRAYFRVECFKIDKAEVYDMLQFLEVMGELRHQHWKRQMTIK